MVEILQKNLQRTLGSSIPNELIDLLVKYSFQKSFDKKELLAEAGVDCKYQYFILEGSAYSFYVNDKGEKNVIQLAIEEYWITDAASYFTGKPAVATIETLEPTTALLINRKDYDKLCCSHPLFDKFFRILMQNALASLHQRIAKTISEEAELRYREFSEKYPHFIQRIPQYLIASYLGIRPQSLSRIRKNIFQK
ncbi:Crp/Fnr family transcriptional regulator [Gramella sp. GC03-9]|uniref:Crp/Fnr family transcriptional regulator n=1 Tax=Christiangramia oceanisediminis TaxID=2920386 RepID=A0A9X2RDR0_9FLAO|nr:Crp/Fnr family transcriptional regulator [Gramella oceanisediminis]MCP9200816.1 Crp/Fnr family transcriptional regulator [Gramella oceanisediminis]